MVITKMGVVSYFGIDGQSIGHLFPMHVISSHTFGGSLETCME